MHTTKLNPNNYNLANELCQLYEFHISWVGHTHVNEMMYHVVIYLNS